MARPKGLPVDGALIHQERLRQKISTLELARRTRSIARAAQRARGEPMTDPGLTARTICNAENSKSTSTRTARLIAQALGLPYLFVVRHEPDDIAEHLAREGLRPEPPLGIWSGHVQKSDALEASLLSSRRASVSGVSGAGKTMLARHIVQGEGIRNHYPHGVVWIGNSPALRERRYQVVMNQVARALGFTHYLPSTTDHSLEAIGQRFRYSLGRGAVLLVLDDLVEEEVLHWLVPDNSQVGVLITTRNEALASSFGSSHVRLSNSSAAEPKKFFHRYMPEEQQLADATLVELLGHPAPSNTQSPQLTTTQL